MDPSNDLKDRSDTKKQAPRQISMASHNFEDVPKSRWERSWPTIACGAGLFSDGYLSGQGSCFPLRQAVTTANSGQRHRSSQHSAIHHLRRPIRQLERSV